jgi:hypothetical protein
MPPRGIFCAGSIWCMQERAGCLVWVPGAVQQQERKVFGRIDFGNKKIGQIEAESILKRGT